MTATTLTGQPDPLRKTSDMPLEMRPPYGGSVEIRDGVWETEDGYKVERFREFDLMTLRRFSAYYVRDLDGRWHGGDDTLDSAREVIAWARARRRRS